MNTTLKNCPRCGQQAIDWAVTCARCQHLFPKADAPVLADHSDLLRAMARMKSYTEACVVVVILYFCLFIPGLLANYLYLADANRMERLAGMDLPGVSFLRNVWAFMVACALFILALIGLAAIR